MKELHRQVSNVKSSGEIGVGYMQAWEEKAYIRAEGFREGFKLGLDRINRLNVRLAEQGRIEDIVKAARDKEYRESLFEEFEL